MILKDTSTVTTRLWIICVISLQGYETGHILTNLKMKKRCVRYQALCPVSSAVSDIKRCVRYQALCPVSSAVSGILHVSSIKRCIQFLIIGWFYMF